MKLKEEGCGRQTCNDCHDAHIQAFMPWGMGRIHNLF